MENLTHIFRTFFTLGPEQTVLLQARYCPVFLEILGVAVHPVLGGIVGPLLMTENSLDVHALERLRLMIFNAHHHNDLDGEAKKESHR